MNVAVIYYSLEGNTKYVAEKIAKKYNTDVYELKVKKDIKANGFFKYFFGGKQVFMKQKPELESLDIPLDKYDYIFIGTPVWAFTFAPAIRSFFDKYKINNKKIILFCTHEGGPENTIFDMKENLINNEVISEIDVMNVLKDKENSEIKIDKWLDDLVLE